MGGSILLGDHVCYGRVRQYRRVVIVPNVEFMFVAIQCVTRGPLMAAFVRHLKCLLCIYSASYLHYIPHG